jgi:putative transcriptional regulator
VPDDMRGVGGRLLVATPPLVDPNFDRTVVFVIHHDARGALGLVLDRVDPVAGTDPNGWLEHTSAPRRVFVGGPVNPDGFIGLARCTDDIDDATWSRFDAPDHLGVLGTIDLAVDPVTSNPPVDALRIYRGHAGWGPGQLEGELDGGAWIVVDAHRDDLFTTDPTTMWRDVLRRQPGRLAWLADAPDDLSLN